MKPLEGHVKLVPIAGNPMDGRGQRARTIQGQPVWKRSERIGSAVRPGILGRKEAGLLRCDVLAERPGQGRALDQDLVVASPIQLRGRTAGECPQQTRRLLAVVEFAPAQKVENLSALRCAQRVGIEERADRIAEV